MRVLRRVTAYLLIFLMVFQSLSMETFADVDSSGDWEFELYNTVEGIDYYRIIRYTGNDPVVRVPEEIDGYPITALSEEAFTDKIYEIYIPSTITEIHESAFSLAMDLKAVYFEGRFSTSSAGLLQNPPSDYCFYYDASYSNPFGTDTNISALPSTDFSTLISAGTLNITGDVFYWFSGVTGNFYIYGSGGLPANDSTYSNCMKNFRSSIQTAYIGSEITTISNNVLYDLPALQTIIFDENYTGILNANLYSPNLSCVRTGASADSETGFNCIGSVTLPDGVTSLNSDFRVYSNYLTGSLHLPDELTYIGNYTFQGSQLTGKLMIPSAVSSIGQGAFNRSAFSSLEILGNYTYLGNSAFSSMPNLNSVTFGSSVTAINPSKNAGAIVSEQVFYDCPNLKTLTFIGIQPPAISTYYLNQFSYSYSYEFSGLPIELIYVPASAADTYRVNYQYAGLSSRIISWYDSSSGAPTPSVMTDVQAASDFNNIQISWGRSLEVESELYQVYRKAENEEYFTLVKTIPGRDNTSFTDTTALQNTIYTYYVTVKNGYGVVSAPSETVSIQRAGDSETPVIHTFTPVNDTKLHAVSQLYLYYTDAEDLAGAVFYVSTDNGETYTELGRQTNDSTVSTTYMSWYYDLDTTALSDGQIVIKAEAMDRSGKVSEPVIRSYTIDNTPPAAVSNLRSEIINSTTANLLFDPSQEEDFGHYVISRYTLDGPHYPDGSPVINTMESSYKKTQCQFTQDPGREYFYRVYAVDKIGNVSEVSEISIITIADEEAPVINGAECTKTYLNADTIIKISASDNASLASISLEWSYDGENWTQADVKTYTGNLPASDQASLTLSAAALAEGTVYVRARAVDAAGNEVILSEENYLSFIIDRTAPETPVDLSAGGGAESVVISWFNGSEEELTFDLYRKSGEEDYQLISGDLTGTSFEDFNVVSGIDYSYMLYAKDTAGNASEPADPVTGRIKDDVKAPELRYVYPENGSKIGPSNTTISVTPVDNTMLSSAVLKYRIEGESEYHILTELTDISSYYTYLNGELPIDSIPDGTKVYIYAEATDSFANTGILTEEVYYYADRSAPEISELTLSVSGTTCTFSYSCSSEDAEGFILYLINPDGSEKQFKQLSVNASGSYRTSYTFKKDSIEGLYRFRVEAYDVCGNKASETVGDFEFIKPAPVDEMPVALMNIPHFMETGSSEYFDASSSSDDQGITEYFWDFGDGTSSKVVKPVKKYTMAGDYQVILTVTDTIGQKSSKSMLVSVRERTVIGCLKLTIIDEDGSPVEEAGIYMDLGEDNQEKYIAGSDGRFSVTTTSGSHYLGVYKNGYLPAKKEITVLGNASRNVTIVLTKEPIVSGEFTIKRMSLNEIIEEGIDPYLPENQQVFRVSVVLEYGKQKEELCYLRNSEGLIKWSQNVLKSSGSHSGGGSDDNIRPDSKEVIDFDKILGLNIYTKDDVEVLAIIRADIETSALKEFFDVNLQIVNNSSSEFELAGDIHMTVDQGLTIMSSDVSGDLTGVLETVISEDGHSVSVVGMHFNGQSVINNRFIIRGDEVGSYPLQADFNGILTEFNEPVKVHFESEENIEVRGFNGISLTMEVNDEIYQNALYYNLILENSSDVDLLMPKIAFEDILQNITYSAYQKSQDPLMKSDAEKDFSITSEIQNVKLVSPDGSCRYIEFAHNIQGGYLSLDKLSPGEQVVLECAAYNAVDTGKIIYFRDASKEILSDIGGNFSIYSVHMNFFDDEAFSESLLKLASGEADYQNAKNFLTNPENYYYEQLISDNPTMSAISRFLYKKANAITTLDADKLFEGDERRELAESILFEILTDSNIMELSEKVIDETVMKALKDHLSLVRSDLSKITRIEAQNMVNEMYKYDFTFTRDAQGNQVIAEYDVYLKVGDDYLLVESNHTSREEPIMIELDLWGNPKDTTKTRAGLTQDEFEAEMVNDLWTFAETGILAINDLLGNYTKLKRLVDVYKKNGLKGVENETMQEIVILLDSAMLSGVHYYLMNNDVLNESYIKSLTKSMKYGSTVLDYAVLKPIAVMNNELYHEQVYRVLSSDAYIIAVTDLLNLIISYTESSGLKYYKSEILSVAEEIKTNIENNAYDLYASVFSELVDLTVKGMGVDLLRFSIKKILTTYLPKANLIFSLAGAAFAALDANQKWGKKIESKDTMRLVSDLSAVFSNAVNSEYDAYILDPQYTNYTDSHEYRMNLSIRMLSNLRLYGEDKFAGYVKSLEDDLFEEINEANDWKYANISEVYSEKNTAVLRARDLFFNVKSTSGTVTPPAPYVTYDYDTEKTVQNFSSDYEYCLSDGIWKDCDGQQISVPLKTIASILRVRKKGIDGNPSGDITTLELMAKREFSKTMQAAYDDGVYTFTDVLGIYEYQICDADALVEAAYEELRASMEESSDEEEIKLDLKSLELSALDWEDAKVMNGREGNTLAWEEHKYIAIRTLGNEARYETTSHVRVIEVQKRQPLNIQVYGCGEITVSGNGLYFPKEEVVLSAAADEGYEFLGWYIDDETMGDDLMLIADVDTQKTIYARFSGVSPRDIVNIRIPSAPAKLVYHENEELDLSGIVVTIDKTDGSSENITDYTVKGNTGKPGKQEVSVEYKGQRITYTITVEHNLKTEKAKASLEKDGYSRTYCETCGEEITYKTINRINSVSLNATSFVYDGKVHQPLVIAKTAAGKTMTLNSSYTVSYSSGCKNAGTYKVTVKFCGNYEGTTTLTYKITRRDISKAVLAKKDYTYSGKDIKPKAVTVTNWKGSTLTKDTHYTVSYASECENVGKYTMTVKGKGNYSGSIKLTYTINPRTPEIETTTSLYSSFRVSWTKQSAQTDGFIIYYSKDKTFKSGVQKYTVKTTDVRSAKVSSITNGGTYYVRMRAYKKVGTITYYSDYSNIKSVKVK